MNVEKQPVYACGDVAARRQIPVKISLPDGPYKLDPCHAFARNETRRLVQT